MFTKSEYEAIQVNKDAYNRAYEEAESLRQLRHAGMLKPNKITSLAYKGLAFVGHLMVNAGKRLEQVETGSTLQTTEFKAAQAD